MDILKLDVEGYEKEVLLTLRDILRRDQPVMLIELIGEQTKGGFRSEIEFREMLYPDAMLYGVSGASTPRLEPFRWGDEEVLCLPKRLKEDFLEINDLSNKS